MLAGEAEGGRSGGGVGLTVREITVVLCKLPEAPVMMRVAVPVVAELPAVRVRVLPLVAGLGVKLAVTPLGKPEADSVTLPLNPFCGVTVMLLVPLPPCTRIKLAG